MANVSTSQSFVPARIVLALMLLWAPLPFGAVQGWAWPTLTLLTLLILILWMIGCIRAGTLRFAYTPIFIPITLMLALGVLQLAFHLTKTPFATKDSVLKLATYIILLFLVVQLYANAPIETWRRLGLAVLIFGFIFSFLSILQSLWNPARIIWVGHDLASPFGPYVDRDHYAGLMELLLPLGASYVLSRPKRDPLNGILWFAVLVPGASLLITGSRGGVLAASAEILILGWVVLRHYSLPEKRIKVAAMGAALLVTAGLFFWLVPSYFLAKIGTVKNYVPGKSREGRPTLWRDSFGIFRDHPIFGTGMGSFGSMYPPHQTDPLDLVTEHSHNDYLEALTETGLVGEVLILWTVGLLISGMFRNLGSELKYEQRWLQLGASISCCGLLLHSFVDFNLQIPANATWFGFCAGLGLLSGRIVSRPQPERLT